MATKAPSNRLSTANGDTPELDALGIPLGAAGSPLRKGKALEVSITAPNFKRLTIPIVGTAPYVQNKFSARAKDAFRQKMVEGAQSKKGKKREPRDFDADFQGAIHYAEDGWYGIPASCFRNGMISACRLVGFRMTLAKLGVFVEADGYDRDEGLPLVRITRGTPKKLEMAVRNESGVADIRARPQWMQWEADVRIRFDADLFSEADIGNLMLRLGQQVGIGSGRPDSKESAGLGWGLFDIRHEAAEVEAQ